MSWNGLRQKPHLTPKFSLEIFILDPRGRKLSEKEGEGVGVERAEGIWMSWLVFKVVILDWLSSSSPTARKEEKKRGPLPWNVTRGNLTRWVGPKQWLQTYTTLTHYAGALGVLGALGVDIFPPQYAFSFMMPRDTLGKKNLTLTLFITFSLLMLLDLNQQLSIEV